MTNEEKRDEARHYVHEGETGSFKLEGHDATLRHFTYPQTMLTVAQSLIDQGQFSVAVVVAIMASEIATERSLSEAFVTKSVQYLEEPVTEFLNGYSLANQRIRKLYTALTGDEVQKAAFWHKFKNASDRRNKIIHGGLIVGKAEAEESCKAANDLVAHLKK